MNRRELTTQLGIGALGGLAGALLSPFMDGLIYKRFYQDTHKIDVTIERVPDVDWFVVSIFNSGDVAETNIEGDIHLDGGGQDGLDVEVLYEGREPSVVRHMLVVERRNDLSSAGNTVYRFNAPRLSPRDTARVTIKELEPISIIEVFVQTDSVSDQALWRISSN